AKRPSLLMAVADPDSEIVRIEARYRNLIIRLPQKRFLWMSPGYRDRGSAT
ncbi:MAG: hypothetical protein ACI87O_001317, partial [Planctomycetota bacterium]